jgi:predicted transcriptional regulator
MAKTTISKRTDRGSDQFLLRLPDGMRKQLAEVAEREGRTMSAVIVVALAAYFEQERQSAALHAHFKANRLETGTVTIEDIDRKLSELIKKADTSELVEMLKQQLKK